MLTRDQAVEAVTDRPPAYSLPPPLRSAAVRSPALLTLALLRGYGARCMAVDDHAVSLRCPRTVVARVLRADGRHLDARCPTAWLAVCGHHAPDDAEGTVVPVRPPRREHPRRAWR